MCVCVCVCVCFYPDACVCVCVYLVTSLHAVCPQPKVMMDIPHIMEDVDETDCCIRVPAVGTHWNMTPMTSQAMPLPTDTF